MTAKTFNNDIFILVTISALAVTALILGVISIPSPQEKRNMEYDAERTKHLSSLSGRIEDYYREVNELPNKLEDLNNIDTYVDYSDSTMKDPETKEMYEYRVVSPQDYKLCATFSTDSSKMKAVYEVDYYEVKKFSHPKGNKCFDLKIQDYNSSSSQSIKKASSTASASLSSLTKEDDCRWDVSFALKGFSPNSKLTIESEGTLTENCDPSMKHSYSWKGETKYTTNADGMAIVEYSHNDYGIYNYTFIDEDGNSATTQVKYGPSPTPPAPTLSNTYNRAP